MVKEVQINREQFNQLQSITKPQLCKDYTNALVEMHRLLVIATMLYKPHFHKSWDTF